MKTPLQEGFQLPGEWAPHTACWVAWPSDVSMWKDPEATQASFAGLCRGIAESERLEVLVMDAAAEESAKKALAGLNARFHPIPFGDLWLRDTAPIFLTHPSGKVAAARFAFNGWGGKYILPHDDQVATRVAERSGLPTFAFPFVLEGGSVDGDGEGTLLTTKQCVLNPNRNPKMSQAELDEALEQALGVQKVIWLNQGLLNDHTDGHVDTVARFVRPGVVLCMAPSGKEDPNHDVLEELARDLAASTDAKGRRLEVVRIPSPGKVLDDSGRVMPASYVNFYIANKTVIVPTYGAPNDDAAVKGIAALFPTRRTIGVNAKAILTEGGAFHCITQQQPSGTTP